MIDTRSQWISELERLSPIIKAYDLTLALKKDGGTRNQSTGARSVRCASARR